MHFFSRVISPLILFAYIILETYLKIQKSSICTTTGCELAAELLKFDSLYLNYFGAAGAIAISFLGFLSLKRKEFETVFYSVLYAAIAFESIMIGYQIFANPEPCSFCMGVYGLLLLIALLSNWKYLLYAMPAIIALFISLASMAIPQNKILFAEDGTYLIYSDNCPHCTNVKKFFAEKNIAHTLVSVRDTTVIAFIKRLNITQIPVLVVKKGDINSVIKGDKSIIEYFSDQKATGDKSAPKDTAPSQIYNSDDGGCSASILSDSGCSEESAVPLY